MNRLELNWIGKYDKQNQINPEPRLLFENKEYSYRQEINAQIELEHTKPTYDNLLVHGDNLLALRALELEYGGKINCIYVDPPYNIDAAEGVYVDNIEHSKWLTLIKARFEILWSLLHKDDGSLWVSIDDYEMPYLRVLLDELCGRKKFIASNVWQKRYSRENREAIGDVHEYIIVYAKNPQRFKQIRNKIPLDSKQQKVYRNPNNDPQGPWRPIPMTAQEGHATAQQYYEITSPSGKVFTPPQGRCWGLSKATFNSLLLEGRIYFGKNGDSQPNVIRYLSEVEGFAPWTWWPSDEVGHTDEAKKEIHALFGKNNAFPTPKPERLIERILTIATNENDIVLDSFLGSGTTAAVAHKMGRRWIGIELGDHAYSLCVPRLKSVIDGEQGGISNSVNWKGGGGYTFLELAPSLLIKDDREHYVISEEYNSIALAAAMAMHKGFTYAPNGTVYWKQGIRNQNSFIFTTTNYIYGEYLDKLNSEMDENETLLICCKAYAKECNKRYRHITVQKIPDILFGRCEFGKDNYDLNIILHDIDSTCTTDSDEE